MSGQTADGAAINFYIDQKGQEHIVTFAIENWWSADISSFITQAPSDFNVKCQEDTEVIQFTYQNQDKIFQHKHDGMNTKQIVTT